MKTINWTEVILTVLTLGFNLLSRKRKRKSSASDKGGTGGETPRSDSTAQ